MIMCEKIQVSVSSKDVIPTFQKVRTIDIILVDRAFVNNAQCFENDAIVVDGYSLCIYL